jgi:hypothetical protein
MPGQRPRVREVDCKGVRLAATLANVVCNGAQPLRVAGKQEYVTASAGEKPRRGFAYAT